MDRAFWLERWTQGEIGFHLPRPHPQLQRYWDRVAGAGTAATVLVPLCGKSLDMLWLSARGHDVCGVELSAQALADFVAESALGLDAAADGYRGSGWHLHCGDWFEFISPERFSLFYDRAALIALPEVMRGLYIEKLLAQLSSRARGLLITLEYSQAEMSGPPFSVDSQEVRRRFTSRASLTELSRAEIIDHEPRFRERGLRSLQEVVWLVECHH